MKTAVQHKYVWLVEENFREMPLCHEKLEPQFCGFSLQDSILCQPVSFLAVNLLSDKFSEQLPFDIVPNSSFEGSKALKSARELQSFLGSIFQHFLQMKFF